MAVGMKEAHKKRQVYLHLFPKVHGGKAPRNDWNYNKKNNL